MNYFCHFHLHFPRLPKEVLEFHEKGCPRRSGGFGDVLAGTLGTVPPDQKASEASTKRAQHQNRKPAQGGSPIVGLSMLKQKAGPSCTLTKGVNMYQHPSD